jgi:hypothetical protein
VRIAHDVRAIASGGGRPPPDQPIALGCDATADAPWTAPAKVDDRTVDYLLSVRRGFETLGDVARGLAALLILEASGARVPRDHPALCCARSDLAEAEAVIRASRPTPTAVHPHRHLVASADRLGAVTASMSKPRDIDARQTLALLREALDHLSSAERTLPGFEIVALGEGCACCAAPGR